jgi:hypothetical protein
MEIQIVNQVWNAEGNFKERSVIKMLQKNIFIIKTEKVTFYFAR